MNISSVRNNFFKLTPKNKAISAVSAPNFNIAFGAKMNIPFYAIGADGSIVRCTDRELASKQFGISMCALSSYLNGHTEPRGNYSFVYAEDFETTADDGTVVPNKEKLIKFRPNTAFYAVNIRTREYKKFYDNKTASEYTGVRPSYIGNCLCGVHKTSGEYAFVKAKQVDVYDPENDCFICDEKKLLKIVPKKPLGDDREFYVIHKDGTYKKYDCRKQAEKETKISAATISTCLNKKIEFTKKCSFVFSDEIEDADNKPDKKKINQIVRAMRKDDFYSVDKDGNCILFEEQKQAKEVLGYPALNVGGCLRGTSNTSHGFAFVNASILEVEQEDGSIVLDKNKIIELQKQVQKEAVYILKSDGTYKRIESKSKANIEHQGIYYSPSLKRFKPNNGFYYVAAKDVETIDENGKILFDENELKSRFEEYRKSAIYVVDKDNNYQRYNNRGYACILGEGISHDDKRKRFVLEEGYRIAKATDVESLDEEGIYRLDRDKLLEIAA